MQVARPPFKKRSLKIPTPDNLSNVALHYLGRYAASESSLRRVLMNRLRRVAMQNPDFAADHERQKQLQQAIEDIIARHKKTGALNDAAFAETKINSLRRAGRSRRAIQQRLSHKGVSPTIIDDMLQRNDDGEDPAATDLKAALQLARRRKLGKFRRARMTNNAKPTNDFELLRKDMATLARAGFSHDIARQALGSHSDSDDQNDESF